jgi:hypothetical protein
VRSTRRAEIPPRALAASTGNIGAAIWLLCNAHRGGRKSSKCRN